LADIHLQVITPVNLVVDEVTRYRPAPVIGCCGSRALILYLPKELRYKKAHTKKMIVEGGIAEVRDVRLRF
jgi:hypothetical protein